jgi:Ca-activated chloride channel family protein
MNYQFILSVFLLYVCNMHANLNTEIQYGRAAQDAQQGNWQDAHKRLNQLVTDNPKRADVLYDSGVAAYRLKNFESAQAYFRHVTEHEDVTSELKERAHFNLGNTYVATKQLQEAIDEYEKVLDINPDNTHAQDNLRIVKQMLEQEKQNQQKKDQEKKQQKEEQQKKQEQQKNQQQGQQKQDQDCNNKSETSKDSQNQDMQQDGQKDQQQRESGDQKKSEDQQSEKGGDDHPQSNDNANANSDAQQEKKDREQKNQTDHAGQEEKEQKQGNGEQRPQSGFDDKQSQQQQADKEQDKHGREPSQDTSEKETGAFQGTQDQQKKQGVQQAVADIAEQEEKAMDPHERWIAGIMKEQEKSDAQANKAFIRQAINKGGSKQHGQKNW